jgi:hypothetical protein
MDTAWLDSYDHTYIDILSKDSVFQKIRKVADDLKKEIKLADDIQILQGVTSVTRTIDTPRRFVVQIIPLRFTRLMRSPTPH